ncbi:DUF6888 family protein [Gloeobacter violaceus]|uniref:Gsr0520 protein n=1 Tax=Gloeobacter violaceus (strain ATCC 29082 / PCC 7421) TaxID=251221 RepID=Q7NN93_GLOVI|nr:gsr0520 [Gloeobacter violaceus PCC 7421]
MPFLLPLYPWPTPEQAMACFVICCRLTFLLQPVQLVRLDTRYNEVYILAGESFQVVISATGYVRYL